MPTRTHIDPFAPGHPPSQAELEGYIRGELDADQAHAVERWLESDPLTREALEGLGMPGALDAMRSMIPERRTSQRKKVRKLPPPI